MGVEWLNRYVALEREDEYGVEPGAILTLTTTAVGSGYGNDGSGTWTLGTKAATVRGGFNAKGTWTTGNSGELTMVLTEGGQDYNDLSNLAFSDFTFSPALSGGSSFTFSVTFDDSNGVTYGEVDDESMKQTFELLARSDMSRQVASKAVTNTQFGEGTINLAVQPDDFMGKILHSFLPATEEGDKFIESITISNAGSGYDNGTFALGFTGGTPTESAEAIATVVGGAVDKVYITNPGKGYNGVPTVTTSNLTSGSSVSLTAVRGTARHHIFNEPVLSTHAYPSYTMRVGRGDKEHTFTGMVASKLSFSANLNEYVMASVDFIGKNEETPTTLVADVDYAGLAVDALHFADAEVYFADNANKTIKVQQISFEININRDMDSAYAVGNRSFTRAPPTTMREITGTMEFNEVLYSDTAGYINEPTYTQLTGSSVHKIQPGAGKDAIRIKFASEDGNDYLEFKFFNVRFEAPTASVSGRDPNRMSVGFQAFYDASSLGAAKAIEAKLVGSGSHVQTTAYDA
jgi:hypothetical protein